MKAPVRAASTVNVTLATPGATMDGVTLSSGDRVLLKNQTSQSQNGLYVWTGASSTLTRTTDADSAADFEYGFQVFVREGSVNGGTYWAFTTVVSITLETTSLAFGPLGVSSALSASLAKSAVAANLYLAANFT
jgi:phage-related tail fiber protein